MALPKTITHLSGPALAAALFLLAGCANTQSRAARNLPQNESRSTPRLAAESRNTYPVTHAPARGGADAMTAPTEPDSIAFDSPSSTSGESRHAALIGLYGELVDVPAPARGRFDGAGNLAQITAVTEGGCFQPDVDFRGTTLVFASTQHSHAADIYMKSTSGRTQRRLTSDPADDMMPALAPDGQRVAFASNRYGNWDIFLTTVDGAPARQITGDSDDELHPTWSPDGQRLAYCKLGTQSGRWEIWVVDVNNPSAPRFLEYGLFPKWNPDPARSKIVFQRARERGSRLFSIWTIDYVAGEARHPTEIVSAANAAVMHPSWSPDGSRIVFVTVIEPDRHAGTRPTQSDVWVVDLNGNGRTNLTGDRALNLNPVWAADGTVYFLSDRSGRDNIWAVATGRTIEVPPQTQGEYVNVDPETQRPSERP